MAFFFSVFQTNTSKQWHKGSLKFMPCYTHCHYRCSEGSAASLERLLGAYRVLAKLQKSVSFLLTLTWFRNPLLFSCIVLCWFCFILSCHNWNICCSSKKKDWWKVMSQLPHYTRWITLLLQVITSKGTKHPCTVGPNDLALIYCEQCDCSNYFCFLLQGKLTMIGKSKEWNWGLLLSSCTSYSFRSGRIHL